MNNKSKGKILVIDDEQGIREMLSYLLIDYGYDVITKEDGEKGVEEFKQNKFDLVISDIKMPKLDGIGVIKALKQIDPEVEIIIVTGYGTIEQSVEAMKRGAYDFIQKPFMIEEVVALIEKALEKRTLKDIINLYKNSKDIFSIVKMEDLIPKIVDLGLKVFQSDEISIILYGKNEEIFIAGSHNLDIEEKRASRLTFVQKIVEETVKVNEPIIINEPLNKDKRFINIKNLEDINSAIIYPLHVGTEVLGFLNANWLEKKSTFDIKDLPKVSIFIVQISQALANAKLYKELEIQTKETKKYSKELEIAYKKLKQTQAQLLQADKMAAIGTLAAGVAHEINNPVAYIKGNLSIYSKFYKIIVDFLGLINSRKDEIVTYEKIVEARNQTDLDYYIETMPGILHTCSEGVEKITDIVSNLKNFSHPENGWKKSNINNIIKETISIVWNELKYKADVIKEFGDIPDIECSSQQLGQVFMNILVNASHVIEKKGIITIKTYTEKNNIIIKISDTGKGISEKNIDRIFEPFFTTKDVGKGTGLGLSIVYDIIQNHNGIITVESEINKGTTFTIELPVDEKIKKKRILIVDDDKNIRRTIEVNLRKKYLIKLAEDGFAAGRLISEFKPDLVLLDILMPGIKGTEVCKEIKKSPETKNIKVIAVTGLATEKSELLKYGFDYILKKPFDVRKLLEAVSKVLKMEVRSGKCEVRSEK